MAFMMNKRFYYCPPWKITRWGFMWKERYFLPSKGCDEWHNKSWFIIIPLLGEVTWFPKKGFDRSGEEHLYAYGPDGTEGRIDPDCDLCLEFLKEIL